MLYVCGCVCVMLGCGFGKLFVMKCSVSVMNCVWIGGLFVVLCRRLSCCGLYLVVLNG